MLVKNYRILLEQFYCLHATADGNWHTQITEKVLLNSANYSISIVRSKQTLHKQQQQPFKRPLFQENLGKPVPER